VLSSRGPIRVVALATGLALVAWPALADAALPEPKVPEGRAIAIAKRDSKAAEALRADPGLHASAERDDGTGDWEVGLFSDDAQVVQVVVDDTSGEVEESWTGHQVAWRMARGYEGAFGRKLNAPYVWLPLCALFVLGLLDWRRLRRIAHLDLVVIVAGFGLSHFFFNRGEIGLSVPLAYPALIYLLGRMLWVAVRGGAGLRPSAPAIWLAVGALFLAGFKVGLNIADSNVIDVGYAGVIGADRIADGETLYGNYPDTNHAGDTYGPVAYYAYVPFEQALPWGGGWDKLPAAHAAAIFFELATLALLFALGRRLRPGEAGTALGAALAFAWAACPYSAYALESNTNDALVSALLVATLLVLSSPPLRGLMLALATATKFAPVALFPLFATYRGPTAENDPAAAARPAARTVGLFTVVFAVTLAVTSLQFLLDPGLSTVWDRTLGNQLGRQSPFSIWGQEPSLEWLQTALKLAVAALAIVVAFRPRRRDLATVAALGAAVLLATQLIAEHWFYLYIPWFLPFLMVALLARPGRSEAEPNPVRGH
jgi:hypothetical protein